MLKILDVKGHSEENQLQIMNPLDATTPTFSESHMHSAFWKDQVEAKLEGYGDAENERIVDATIDRYIEKCRGLYTNRLISERTRQEYEKMWAELRTERRIGWMAQNVRYLKETIDDAKDYEREFKAKLNEAVDKKWIGKLTRANWMNRFKNPEWLEWDRKRWMEKDFKGIWQGWEEVADRRLKVRRLAKKLGVDDRQIPELQDIYKIQDFLSLHHDDRETKVFAAKAALLAYEKNEQTFLHALEEELREAVTGGYLHQNKVEQWMARVMEAENPRAFRSDVLLPFMRNWQGASETYDQLHETMNQTKVPRGLRVISKGQFLLLSYEQRLSYLHEVDLRMKDKEEKDPALNSFKKKIRHNLDTKDWEGAEEVLTEAQQLYPYDEDLDSMENFLRLHRVPDNAVAEKNESPDPRETLAEMRAIISELPGDLQWLYIEAAKEGPAVFNRLLQIFYNRVWVYENRYGNEQLDREEAESEWNKQKTEEYIENGHSRKFERNIIDGDTAEEAAIRDECTKPQVLYMGDSGRDAVLRKVKVNRDNEMFGYWTTLVPTDVPYAEHRSIVKNFHHKLKSGLRSLHQQGYAFTMSGSPQCTSTATRPVQKQTTSASSASRAMAA